MGDGGLQGYLTERCAFLLAMSVDQNSNAVIASDPPFAAFLGESARYDDRHKIARFLEDA